MDADDVTESGRLFHTQAAATEKAWSPSQNAPWLGWLVPYSPMNKAVAVTRHPSPIQAENMDKTAENLADGEPESCPCSLCLNDVTSEGVCCDWCGNWFHCRCQGISNRSAVQSLKQFKHEPHWFCRGRQAVAEKLLQIVSRIQTKVAKIEEEVVRVKSEIRTELAKAIKEPRTEFDSRITVCETRITDHQQDIQKSIDSKLAVMEDKMRNDSVSGIVGTGSKSSWVDVVSKDVESNIHGVTADVTVLQ